MRYEQTWPHSCAVLYLSPSGDEIASDADVSAVFDSSEEGSDDGFKDSD